jgi:biopolymer transport protein TolQ
MTTIESATEITQTSVQTDLSLISLISSSDFVSKVVLFILLACSIWTWAIAFSKFFTIKQMRSKIVSFETLFWSGQLLEQLYENVKRNIDNPLAAIFVNAMNECKRGKKNVISDGGLRIGHKDRVLQSMMLSKDREIATLDSGLVFLAAIGSNAPFIGLLGTVLGIMHSFEAIGGGNSPSVISAVAPALFLTAVALGVGICATVIHNYFTSQAKAISDKIEEFIIELNIILSRAIDEERL